MPEGPGKPWPVLFRQPAASAIAFEAAQRVQDFAITIAHRPAAREKADALAQELAAFARRRGDKGFLVRTETYEELRLDASQSFDLLINCTSVGMVPRAGESPVPEGVAARCRAVFDAVYNPGRTQLLRFAENEIWYGTRFCPEDIEALCRDAAAEMEKTFGRNEA